MMHETRSIGVEGDFLDLDPFAFWPNVRSRLVGFGGDEAAENPDYVFHTLYVACGTGPIVFTVSFAGIKASRGTLILRIHELPEVMGAQARQIALSQTQLVDLIRGDGSTSLTSEARAGNHYALLGYIYGDTVALANSVAITIARRAVSPSDSSLPSRFHAPPARIGIAAQIVSEQEGLLSAPASQLCTVRQVHEPIFTAMLEQLQLPPDASTIDRWESAYLARVLDRYDVARAGARGLGIDAIDDPVGHWLLKHGCSLVLSVSDERAVTDLSPHVETIVVDPLAIHGLVGFDFAWARRAAWMFSASRQDLLSFIEDALSTLKPGGLLVAIIPIDVAIREIGDDIGPMMRRPDIDRIVMVLLSRGHQVAQVSPWGKALAELDEKGAVMMSAFGLIVRKALS